MYFKMESKMRGLFVLDRFLLWEKLLTFLNWTLMKLRKYELNSTIYINFLKTFYIFWLDINVCNKKYN